MACLPAKSLTRSVLLTREALWHGVLIQFETPVPRSNCLLDQEWQWVFGWRSTVVSQSTGMHPQICAMTLT